MDSVSFLIPPSFARAALACPSYPFESLPSFIQQNIFQELLPLRRHLYSSFLNLDKVLLLNSLLAPNHYLQNTEYTELYCSLKRIPCLTHAYDLACTQKSWIAVCLINESFGQWADQEGVSEPTHTSGSQHGHLIMFGDISDCKKWRVGGIFATGFSQEETRYAAKHVSMHSKTSPPQIIRIIWLNFTNAKVKKRWYTPMMLSENLYFHILCAAQQ